MKIENRTGKINLTDIINQSVQAIKFVDSWNKEKQNEYTPTTGFKCSENDNDKPARFGFKRPLNGHMDSAKRRQYERIYTHIQKRLYSEDKRMANSTGAKLKLNTLHSYSGKIRKAIQDETGVVSMRRNANIDRLITAYPDYSDQLNRITAASASLLPSVVRLVRNEIADERTIMSENLDVELGKLDFDNLVVRKLSINRGAARERRSAIKKNLLDRKQHEFNFSLSSIKRITADCLASNNFNEMVLGVALATGRRAIECVYTGNFSKTRGKYNVKFTGQAKSSKVFDEHTNIIPLLFDAQTVIDTVERIRKTDFYLRAISAVKANPDIPANIIFNRRMANGLGDTIKAAFDNDNMVFHTSRVIATKVALSAIHGKRKDRKIDDGTFMAIYTGHTSGGVVSFTDNKSYDHVHIDVDGADNIVSRAAKSDKKSEGCSRDIKIMVDLIDAMKSDSLSTNKPFLTWYNKLITNISIYPFKLTQRNIRQGYKHDKTLLKIGGGHAATVKKFNHAIIADHIERYNNSNI